MNLFTRIICLTLLLTALIFVFFRASALSQTSFSSPDLTREVEAITGDVFHFAARTPKGTKIFSVRKPRRSMLLAIDKGLLDLIAIAKSKKYGYTKRLRHSDFTVFIARADRDRNDKGVYSPDIAIGAAQYSGTKYDRGGFIYAAGMVVSLDPGAFTIAEHSKDFDRVSRVVRYEGEHIVLFHNDRKKYIETADHSRGGSHPLLTP